jgi:SAM-dependent methyltransferase
MKTELCEIMTRYGSDKGSGWHNYTEFYHEKFESLKDKELKIFELGLGTNNPNLPSSMGVNGKPGASLRGWKEYFHNSEVYGADIDTNILFEEERIKTFFCDQTKKEIIHYMWNLPELNDKQFDIIIDDGLHECNANMIFLENSIHKLKNDGIYIIEDIINYNIPLYLQYLSNIKNNTNIVYEIIKLENINNTHDNTIIVIKKI